MQQSVMFFLAFVAVLALIGAVAWLVRRFAGNRLGSNANRGRMPRLAVIDAAAVDGRRRLVLVRRDNVEHLLMIGGPSDIVVESNIVRANQNRDSAPQRPSLGADPAPRLPQPEPGWDNEPARAENFDAPEPVVPEPPARPQRPAFVDELRRPAAPALPERRTHEQVPGSMPEPLRRPEPRPDMRAEPLIPRRDPPPMPRVTDPPPKAPPVRAERPVAAAPAVGPSADQNLAEMAQRLEAALRRPGGAEPAEPRVGAPPVAPEPPPSRPAPRAATDTGRREPSIAVPDAPSPKTGFENLEDEMASLLGRPKSPS